MSRNLNPQPVTMADTLTHEAPGAEYTGEVDGHAPVAPDTTDIDSDDYDPSTVAGRDAIVASLMERSPSYAADVDTDESGDTPDDEMVVVYEEDESGDTDETGDTESAPAPTTAPTEKVSVAERRDHASRVWAAAVADGPAMADPAIIGAAFLPVPKSAEFLDVVAGASLFAAMADPELIGTMGDLAILRSAVHGVLAAAGARAAAPVIADPAAERAAAITRLGTMSATLTAARALVSRMEHDYRTVSTTVGALDDTDRETYMAATHVERSPRLVSALDNVAAVWDRQRTPRSARTRSTNADGTPVQRTAGDASAFIPGTSWEHRDRSGVVIGSAVIELDGSWTVTNMTTGVTTPNVTTDKPAPATPASNAAMLAGGGITNGLKYWHAATAE